jgi:hypothetical protein
METIEIMEKLTQALATCAHGKESSIYTTDFSAIAAGTLGAGIFQQMLDSTVFM